MASFTIVGTGTGTGQYIIPEAVKAIEEAQVLIGGERNLAPWIDKDKKSYIIKSPLSGVVDWIKLHYEEEKVVVLVSGDPGFYSLLNFLSNHFPKEEIKVVPGISSMQVAFARLSLPWHDAILLNLHGRPLENLNKYIELPKIALLTDPINNPLAICKYLINKGKENCLIHICVSLGYDDEEIITFNLNKMNVEAAINSKPAVMVIINE